MIERLPITGIVASRKASLLPACLAGISFCDELIVIGIESSDDTAAVEEAHGARVVRHPWVPIAVLARPRVIEHAHHNWLLVRDPGEVLPPALAGRLLRGTVWGGVKRDRLLANRTAVEFPTVVNRRLIRRPACREVVIPPRRDNVIVHYWVTGYRSFFERHRRYLRLAGPDRADAGEITGWRAVLATPWRSFRESFVRENGYRDGLRGLALSALWAWYRRGAELMLLRELRRRTVVADSA